MDASSALKSLRKALRLPFHGKSLYKPLDSENREIRVLRINKSQRHGVDIECSLETVSLNSNPDYQALSYEWSPPGVSEQPGRVLLNSHCVFATPNLRLALKHLQPGLAYWIDALCIDQSDDKERGHQVRLMTEIYRHASAVVAWLGPEEGNSGKGMDFLDEVGTFIESNADVYFHDWLYKTLTNDEYHTRWDGLRQISQRSYWSRLWIVQELVVSPHPDGVWLLCGPRKAQFRHLGRVSLQVRAFRNGLPVFFHEQSLDETINELYELGRRIRDIDAHREAWGSENPEASILILLSGYYQLGCTDPRDKVYALLGVSSPYLGLELPISYKIPINDVYKNLATYVIAGSKKLDILAHAGRDQLASQDGPSWVPNWQRYDFHNSLFRVFWSSSGTLSSVTRYSADDSILITKAFIIGTITSLHKSGIPRSQIDEFPSIGAAYTSGKEELISWLDFITANIRLPENPLPESPTAYVSTAYGILFYLENLPQRAFRRIPLQKFHRLCEQLWLPKDERGEEGDLTFSEISDLVYAMRHQRNICAIELASSIDGQKNQESSGLATEEKDIAIGICSRKARIGDMVTVVRGCMNPLL